MAIYPAGIAQAELLPMLSDVAGIALSGTPYRQAEMDASPAMEVVARIGVGYDAVEVPALTARRVPLMVAGTANSTSVAEHAFHLMMALAKRTPALDAMVRKGDMGRSPWRAADGAVRQDRADRRLRPHRHALGAALPGLRHERADLRSVRRRRRQITGAGCERVTDLDAALPRADFVSIHCPKNPETVGMFNAARLARMKRGAFIVNTARGGIIDEPALHAALTSGHLAGAGLDVFDAEPTPVNNTLLQLDKVITSPHMAGVTTESVAGMAVVTAENILSVLDGKPNRDNVINKEVLD